MENIDFIIKILDTVLPSVFLLITIIIFNSRTFRISFIERKSFISGRERILSIFYLILLVPCVLFFCYGTEVLPGFYRPSLLNRIVWAVHFTISDILLIISLWNRSHFRIFTYIPFIIMMPCYYYVLVENLLTVNNLMTNIWFSLLIAVSSFMIFLPPNITITDGERIDRVTLNFTCF